ncbi:hypothetical protein ACFS07_02310 [Undibacterium arcticum]
MTNKVSQMFQVLVDIAKLPVARLHFDLGLHAEKRQIDLPIFHQAAPALQIVPE